MSPPREDVTSLVLSSRILDSAAGSHDRRRIRLLPSGILSYENNKPPCLSARGLKILSNALQSVSIARAKVKVQKAYSDLSHSATCETESRAAVVPIVGSPEPVQDDPVVVLAKIRDEEEATAAPHDTGPSEDCFS